MGRHEPIRLREVGDAIAANADVIDVSFTEVGGERRTLWDRIKAALQAILWAATIGFLIPPAWVLVQIIGEMFRPL
jgi:hypothetical protein